MSFDYLDLINILNKYFIIDFFWIVFSAIPAIAVYKHNKGRIGKRRHIYGSLFVFYLFLVLSYTVLSRGFNGTIPCQLEFLWSYKAARFNKELLIEIILNYILFIPFGLFYAGAHKKKRKYVFAVIFGFTFSCIIEILQYITHTGLFEFDDILGNTIGAAIGSLIYLSHRKFRLMKKLKRKLIHHKHRHSHKHSWQFFSIRL